MKHVQLATRSISVELPIFAVTDEEFNLLFPGTGQDIEYNEDVLARLGVERARTLFAAMRSREIEHRNVDGLHGLLFWNNDTSRRYYPSKKSNEIILRYISDEAYQRQQEHK